MGTAEGRPGPKVPSLADRIAARTEPVEPGGHVRWTGHRRKKDGTPVLRHEGVQTTAYRLVWFLHAGEMPEGPVRPSCDFDDCCVAFDHLKSQAVPPLADTVTSLDDLARVLALRMERVEPGGHEVWTGQTNRGVPKLRYGREQLETTAYRFVWFLNTGEEPPGTVRPTCEVDLCVAFGHLSCRPAPDFTTTTDTAPGETS